MKTLKLKPIDKQEYNIDCWSENFVSLTECLITEEDREKEKIKKFLEECRLADQKYYNRMGGYIPRKLK